MQWKYNETSDNGPSKIQTTSITSPVTRLHPAFQCISASYIEKLGGAWKRDYSITTSPKWCLLNISSSLQWRVFTRLFLNFFFCRVSEQLSLWTHRSQSQGWILVPCCTLKYVNKSWWIWHCFLYSGTSEQGTRWGQYKFTCFVLFREVVLFSEVVNVLKL